MTMADLMPADGGGINPSKKLKKPPVEKPGGFFYSALPRLAHAGNWDLQAGEIDGNSLLR